MTINEGSEDFAAQVGRRVPSSDLLYANTLSLLGFEVEVYPAEEGDPGGLRYRLHAEDYSAELNCSGYRDAEYVLCQGIRIKGGAEPEPILRELTSRETDSYEEFKWVLFAFQSDWEKSQDDVLDVCKEFAEVYSPEAPEDLCARKERALGLAICYRDMSELRQIAYETPQGPEEFSCYYGSYVSLKNILSQESPEEFLLG